MKKTKAKRIKIVLLKDIENLGRSGSIVEVKDGYAQHLVSSGHASLASQDVMQKVEAKKSSEKFAKKQEENESKKIFEFINDKVIDIGVSAGDNGKLHECVTSSRISEALNKHYSVDIPKNKIRIDNNEHGIRTFGMHDVSVHLFPGIVANIHVNVLQKNI